MANLTIFKFRFPQSLNSWDNKVISNFQTAAQLFAGLGDSEHSLIFCGLASKDDLLQIISFFQKKRQVLRDKPHTVVLVDFQGGGKLLEAAQRLSIDHFLNSNQFLNNEEEMISSLLQKIGEQQGKITSHQTYEDLFSKDKVVLKKNTRRRLYPVEEVTSIETRPPMEMMTETPVVVFKLYEGDKFIESSFLDYFDREVYLMTKVLPEDNNLILEFKSSYLGEKKGLRLKTEVVNIEEGEGEYQLTLKIESHLKEFEAMLKVYQRREQEIGQFMKKVKGH